MIKEFAVISREIKKIIKKYPSPGGDGAEVIYALRNSDALSRTIANEFIKSGQNVRKYYQRRLPSDSSKDYYYMLRNTPNNETIIVEYGFLDSSGDDVNQLKNNWEELTEAVVRGLASYIGVPYIPPTGLESNYYTVKKGDTLYSIARNYGVSVNSLKSANNLTSNNLAVGMTLMIPTNPDIPTSEEIYVVKAGDSLYKIANMFNMTVNELKTLNNLTSNNLSIGQQLKVIKEEMPNANTYIVKSGDSLYSIAKSFGVNVDELKRANNKSSNMLTIGEKLIIPINTTSIPNSGNIYVVKAGDSLYSIASKYNITVNELKNANNKTSNMLSIGEQLVIPNISGPSNGTYYTVKAGDSLWTIAQRYNTTVDAIRKLNNLTSNNLSIGMNLRVL